MMREPWQVFGVVGLLAAWLVAPGQVGATSDHLEPINGTPYMTLENSTIPKSNFDLSEQPFAFIRFDRDDLNTDKPLSVTWTWRFGHKKVAMNSIDLDSFPADPINLWDAIASWDSVKEVGSWSVKTQWLNPTRGGDNTTVNFTVAPEPLSAGFMLLGAPLVALGLHRRKRLFNA